MPREKHPLWHLANAVGTNHEEEIDAAQLLTTIGLSEESAKSLKGHNKARFNLSLCILSLITVIALSWHIIKRLDSIPLATNMSEIGIYFPQPPPTSEPNIQTSPAENIHLRIERNGKIIEADAGKCPVSR